MCSACWVVDFVGGVRVESTSRSVSGSAGEERGIKKPTVRRPHVTVQDIVVRLYLRFMPALREIVLPLWSHGLFPYSSRD